MPGRGQRSSGHRPELREGYFRSIPMLAALVANDVAQGLDLVNSSEIRVYTNNIASVRGRACPLIILDECAFYQSSDSTTASAREVYNSCLPSLATLNGMMAGFSTPWKKSGLLYEKFIKHYGKDDPGVLVIKAPSIKFNPTLDAAYIEKQIEADPEKGNAEWNSVFRSDIGSLVDPQRVAELVMRGRYEWAPMPRYNYSAFADPSGGVLYLFTLCIAHREGDAAIVDCIRERRPPFSTRASCRRVFPAAQDLPRAHRLRRQICGPLAIRTIRQAQHPL